MKKILLLAVVCIALTGCLIDGDKGDPGPGGGQGLTGPVGEMGRPGPAGHNGTNGANGAAGINGSPGVNGAPGTNGTDGMDTPHRWPMLLDGVWLVKVLNPDTGLVCTQELLLSDLNNAVTNEGPYRELLDGKYYIRSYVVADDYSVGYASGYYRIETNPSEDVYAQIVIKYTKAYGEIDNVDCIGMVKTNELATYEASFYHRNEAIPGHPLYYNPNMVTLFEQVANSPPLKVGTFYRLLKNGGTEQPEVSF